MESLPDGLIVVSKRDCPTCTLIEGVMAELAGSDTPLVAYTQDDPIDRSCRAIHAMEGTPA